MENDRWIRFFVDFLSELYFAELWDAFPLQPVNVARSDTLFISFIFLTIPLVLSGQVGSLTADI